ncbi:GumC family protein [Sphingomonas tabacisoli]|uniref:GumC family protein n=1 Tax=Sphingomonas tabacisoli TaxID=2249466 RepID=A0ABW4HXE7_9SPHN
MSLIQFLRILAARKSIIFATLIACFLAALVTVQLLPKRYESHNRVLIDITKPDALVGQISPQMMGAYIATQLKLITDVQTAGLVVDSLGWATDPNNQAAFEAAGRPGGDIRDWLAQQIADNTQAKFAEGSSIIEIVYRGTDPANTQAIAQAVREAFLKLNRDQRVNTAQRSAVAYDEQAKRILTEITSAEEQKTAYAKANGIVLNGLTDAESAKLSAMSGVSAMPTAPQMVAGAQVNAQAEMLKQQIAQAKLTLGPNHPTLQALERQLSVAERQSSSGPSMVGGTTRGQVEAAYEAQKARVLAQGDKIDKLNQMQNDIAVKRDQYTKLASMSEQMKAIARAGDSNLEPMGSTNLPDSPVWPNKPLIVGMAAAFGLGLGVVLALFVELFARRVRSEDDLEYATGAPVLATVGQPRPENSASSRLLRLIDRRGAASSDAVAEA